MAPVSVCKFYVQGRCSYGRECKYGHSLSSRFNGTGLTIAQTNAPPLDAISFFIPANKIEGNASTAGASGIKAFFQDGAVPVSVQLNLTPFDIFKVETQLEVSWFVPTRSTWLLYRKEDIANRALQFFNNRICRGYNLRASLKPSKSTKLWSVQVSNISNDLTHDHVLGDIPDSLYPKEISHGEPSYDDSTAPAELVEARIRAETTLPFEVRHRDNRSNNLQKDVICTFAHPFHLGTTVRGLDGIHVEQLGGLKIFAKERVVVHMSIKRQLYKHHSIKLKQAARTISKEHKVSVAIVENEAEVERTNADDEDVRIIETSTSEETTTAVDNTGEADIDGAGEVTAPDETTSKFKCVVIRLSATDRKSLAVAKAALDEVFVQVLDKALDSKLGKRLKKLQTHLVHLTKTTSYRAAINGGLDRAKEVVGSDNVSLREESDPPAIQVRGSTTVLRRVQECLRDAKEECPICVESTSLYIRMWGCGHAACKDCIVQYLTLHNDARFPLRCFAKDCNEPVQTRQLQILLDEDEFQKILSDAVKDYLNRRPERYTKCAGTDCTTYHPRLDTEKPYTCPRCLTVVCTKCRVGYHFDETCEAHNARINEQDLRRQAELEGLKQCPSCKILVQKSDGCNHIECGSCHKHFCWICLDVFATSALTYRHLEAEHGGYFDEDQQQRPEFQPQGLAEVINQMVALGLARPGQRVPPILIEAFIDEQVRAFNHQEALAAVDPAAEQAL